MWFRPFGLRRGCGRPLCRRGANRGDRGCSCAPGGYGRWLLLFLNSMGGIRSGLNQMQPFAPDIECPLAILLHRGGIGICRISRIDPSQDWYSEYIPRFDDLFIHTKKTVWFAPAATVPACLELTLVGAALACLKIRGDTLTERYAKPANRWHVHACFRNRNDHLHALKNNTPSEHAQTTTVLSC